MQKSDVTGLVLAGGQGSRMGSEKGLMPFRGRPLAWHVLQRLIPQVGFAAISANRQLQTYAQWGVPVWTDLSPNDALGPLAGLLSGLRHAPTPWLLSVPCDTPFFPQDLASRLMHAIKNTSSRLATVRAFTPDDETQSGRAPRQPAFCLAHQSLADNLEAWLETGQRKVGAWMATHSMVEVEFNCPGDDLLSFANANTPQDLSLLEQASRST
jgi:molybdopterin-guanine dinucleotide biosynthesis protein A